MKKMLVLVMALSFVFSGLPAYAGEKGASEQAREHASDNSIFNRVPDWFATVGKSDEEKKQILADRKAKRAQKRAEKMARKKEKEAEKAMKTAGDGADEAKEKAEKKAKKMKKDAGKKMKKPMGSHT